MEIGLAGPISANKIPKPLWDNNKHTTQDGRKILLQLFTFMDI